MKEKYFTARWNNIVPIALGLVALFFFIAVLIAGVGTASFIALVVIGGVT